MAFKIKNFISPLTLTDPDPKPKKKRNNTTDRKVVRKLARQASKNSKEGKETLMETFNESRSQKGSSAPPVTVQTNKKPKKVKKRKIKKALKNANVGRGDKVYVSDGEAKIIKGKPLTRDQKMAALKKKKSDKLAKRVQFKQNKEIQIAAKRKALDEQYKEAKRDRNERMKNKNKTRSKK